MGDLPAGLQLALTGRYTIDREVGHGGMATVYLAHDLKHDRAVAVKVLRPELAASVGAERFLREIKIAAHLQHPHILPLHDSGEGNGFLYYVMPYVQGESLREKLRRDGAMPIAEAVRLLGEITDALSYAHAHGIVHRDIKPENVMLSGRHALVTDFGVAKAVSDAAAEQTLTTLGVAVGTPAYMAPEQAAADPATDHRADLYALGVVGYEMLVGRAPFVARSGAQLLVAHASEAPRSVAELRPECPDALAVLVMRCLDKRPDGRPQHAEEVIRWLDALPTPAGTMASAALPHRARRWVIGGAAIAGVLLVLGGALVVVPSGMRATALTLMARKGAALAPTRVLVAPFENQTGDTTLDALGVMAADWVGQALSRVPNIEVVDPRTALATEEVVRHIPWPLRTRDRARAMAEEAGAGVLVSGTYYREGDTLRFEAKIADVKQGRLVRALAPVSGPRAAPSRIVMALQQRVAASLALASDTTAGTLVGSFAEPPSLEAYQEVYRGVEAYFRGDDSSQYLHLERAARLDPSYTTPLVFLAFARTYNYEYATADTVVRRAERLSDRLAPAERALLDHVEAMIRGDAGEAVLAAERFTKLMPGSQESPLLLASVALSTLRPNLAKAALTRVDPDRGLNLAGPFYWLYQAEAAAQLGDWRRSLDMARAGLRRFPNSPGMSFMTARADARLGRVGDMEQIIATLSTRGDPIVRQARVALDVWGELRAVGHGGDADRLLQHYARLLEAVRTDTARMTRFTRARVLARVGRLEEARVIFAALVASDTGDARLRDLAQLGVAEARLGNRDAALQAEQELAVAHPRYERGTPKLLQAEIAAALGERDRAVLLLRQGRGMGGGLESLGGGLVTNPDLEPLFGYPAFEELLKPQG